MWSVVLRKKIYFVPLVLVAYYYGWMDGWMGLIRVKVRVMFECGQLWVGGLRVR